jgi:dihydrolipoamide dehydrogenase
MGVVAGDNATGHDATDDLNAVPIGQFTHPEVGSIGESEATAKENHERVRVARLQFQSTGTGWAYGEKEGLVKIIADASTGELYGGVVIGYHAVDVLQELALAKKHGLTVWQVFETIHTHPSFAEGVGLTAEDWVSEAIRGAREL